jgi:hypothetical protein
MTDAPFDYTLYAGANGVTFANVDGTGRVLSIATVPKGSAEIHRTASTNNLPVLLTELSKLDGTSNWMFIDGVMTKVDPLVSPLMTAQRFGLLKIDQNAENARGKFVTLGGGQAYAYMAKGSQATDFLNTYTSDTASSASSTDPRWSFLVAEVGITASTLFEVATKIVTRQQENYVGLAQIEAQRRAAKKTIKAATDIPTVNGALVITWPAPSA